MGRSNHRRLRKDIQKYPAIQAYSFPKRSSLRDGLHFDSENRVDNQFHRCPGTRRADMKESFRKSPKYRPDCLKDVRVASDEQDELASFSCQRASGDRNVQDMSSHFGAEPGDLARRVW